jgi:hypothetical protein
VASLRDNLFFELEAHQPLDEKRESLIRLGSPMARQVGKKILNDYFLTPY